MRRFVGIKPCIRWPVQPSARYRSSWTSRKLNFSPSGKDASAPQNAAKAAIMAPAAPVASLDDARRILKEKFGHDTFRAEQETVVSQILAGRNVLIQWPPHSGRSTAYLAAALAETLRPSRDGLIVVVSHDVLFLRYNADVMTSRGVPAAPIHGFGADLTRHEQRVNILRAVCTGELRVLYLHMDFLQDDTVLAAINETQGGLRLLVIDETPAISPGEYSVGGCSLKNLNDFISKARPRNTVILANNHMKEGHPGKYGGIGEPYASHMPWLPQLNLELRMLSSESGPSYRVVRKFLEENPVSTLIFTPKDKAQRDLADYLRRAGFHAQYFDSIDEDMEKLKDFSKSKLPIMVASSPLSDIVDKPGNKLMIGIADLRQIILTKIPRTIEKFDLLCRVAGRDGEPSTCSVVVQPREEFRERNRARAIQTSFSATRTVVNKLFHQYRESFSAGLHSLIWDDNLVLRLDIHGEDLSLTYSLLEHSKGFIKMLGRQYTSCQFEVIPGHESVLKADRTPTGLAILKHSVQVPETGHFGLDIVRAANREGLPHFVELAAKMNSLQSLGHIKVYPRKSLLVFRLVQVPEAGAETEAVARWVHKHLQERYEVKARERRQLRDVLFGNGCISAAIASHFGAQLPGGEPRCGRCSFCLDGKPAKTGAFVPEKADLDKIKTILAEIPARADPRFLARVAVGVYSPKVKKEGLYRHPIFGSMATCRFEDVLEIFARVCGVPTEDA